MVTEIYVRINMYVIQQVPLMLSPIGIHYVQMYTYTVCINISTCTYVIKQMVTE